jgi:hypothetical protein
MSILEASDFFSFDRILFPILISTRDNVQTQIGEYEARLQLLLWPTVNRRSAYRVEKQ